MRMGILDDAIREHLELKRQHGAASEDLDRLEKEAFGPPSRPGDPEFQTGEEALPESRGEGEHAGRPQPADPSSSEQPTTVAPRVEPPPAPADPEEGPEAAAGSPAEEPAEADAPPEAPEHAIFDVEEFGDEDDFPEPVAEVHEAVGAGDARPLEEPPPAAGPSSTTEAARAEREPEAGEEEPEEGPAPPAEASPAPPAEQGARAEGAPTGEQATDAGAEDAVEPEPRRVPDLFEDDEDAPPPPIEHRRRETGEWEDAAAAHDEEPDEREAGVDDDGEDSGGDEDLLEETPDFLRDAPEGERLWFEQGSPRDFDFDDD